MTERYPRARRGTGWPAARSSAILVAMSPAGSLTPPEFVAKWSRVTQPERAVSQEHFIDLCRLLGQPTPAEHDGTGSEYAFEKGVAVSGGASKGAKGDWGFADVWWKGKFGWEYKTKNKYPTLEDAYRQLCQYREALANPPLLVVSDIERIEVHTNFTGTVPAVHTITLDRLAEPESLDILRRVFTDPESFRPTVTAARVTEAVASQVGKLAGALRDRGHDPHEAAHFLMRCVFCLFAEDVGLFGRDPESGKPVELFRKLLNRYRHNPDQLTPRLSELFDRMRTGGAFGTDEIPWFNGGLFDETKALPLQESEIGLLLIAADLDWAAVEPSIFGTLFERSLDPDKRAQIGAHYTSTEDILLVIEPVMMRPLRAEWEQVRAKVAGLLNDRRAAPTEARKKSVNKAIAKALQEFMSRLESVRVLDPACGSGNFLYVAIQQLLNLEKEVITFGARPDLAVPMLPKVRPTQLRGIEINPYAAELAQVVIWIGYLQWMRDNGFNPPKNPILENLSTIENRDAILDVSDPAMPVRARWPKADFIIGNPPFLGSKVFRQNGLDEKYVKALYAAYDLPKTSDLCCYWFEIARRAMKDNQGCRVGLLATQGIRGGDNRTVLERIQEDGAIFCAWADREWVLDGAAVHVSIVCFAGKPEGMRELDGRSVNQINPDLTSDHDTTTAASLAENAGLAFMGDTKGGAFDIEWTEARRLLAQPNQSGRSNGEVVRPWINGGDVTKRPRAMFIVDFGCDMTLEQSAQFAEPLRVVENRVRPERLKNRRASYAEKWWLHVEPRPAMRAALDGLPRFLFTTNTSKHRLFAWISHPTLPDHAGIVFARSDDYFFGVLHSAVHELWARRTGTQLREEESGFRYTPTSCFETFPLPWPPGYEAKADPAYLRIAEAAEQLNAFRERWLNPPEWIEPAARHVDALDKFEDVPEAARPLIRQSAIMALAAKDARLKKRTLTNLYNERPTWLRLAHAKLDRAVLAAYFAIDPAGGWTEDWAAVWEETGAGQPLPEGHPLAARREEVDQAVLRGLLALNRLRARR